MKNSLSLNDGKTVYEFSDEEEYKGVKYIALKKTKTFKDQKEIKVITVKPNDWPAFCDFLEKCMQNRPVGAGPEDGESVPF